MRIPETLLLEPHPPQPTLLQLPPRQLTLQSSANLQSAQPKTETETETRRIAGYNKNIHAGNYYLIAG